MVWQTGECLETGPEMMHSLEMDKGGKTSSPLISVCSVIQDMRNFQNA